MKCNFILGFLICCGLIQTVHSKPPGRICIEYNHVKGNDVKQSKRNIKTCAKSYDKCFIVWTREVKNGKEQTRSLKQGCWTYDNNELEFCGKQCVSLGLYDRANNTEFCCCQADLCNERFTLAKEIRPTRRFSYSTTQKDMQDSKHERQLSTSIISVAGILVVFTSVFVVISLCKNKRASSKDVPVHINEQTLTLPISPQHIRLTSRLTTGKFGEIWLGTFHSKTVAIKMFQNIQKRSWENEKNIYNLGLEHPGILKYFGSLVYPNNNINSFILVLEYHPRGSLRQTLESKIISWYEMCIIVQSMAEGLAFLHGEHADDRNGKFPFIVIAHRDISSENILVKEDGSCLICDFGLSREISLEEEKNAVPNGDHQVGSLRYMAPEALEGHINLNDLVSQLKQIDIYAMGIVLWEISTRCQDLFEGDVVPRFRLPFDQLERNLTLHSMKDYVLVQKMRPPFPEVWNKKDQRVASLLELISDCWDHDADARLSASCVCQRVVALKEHHHSNTA